MRFETTENDMLLAKKLGKVGLCIQMAEECGELQQAVMKYVRTEGIGQPTPVSKVEAIEKIKEELADVIVSCLQLATSLDFSEAELNEIMKQKTERAKMRFADK